MVPYSIDLRRRVLKDCDAGMGTKAAAEVYPRITNFLDPR